MNETTKKLLINHSNTYPGLQPQDVFKYLFQSSFGCEHMVSDEDAVIECIKREYDTVQKDKVPLTEPLDGHYGRVHLSWLNDGLRHETLARLFVLSAKNESDGKAQLTEKLKQAKKLVRDGKLPFDAEVFNNKLDEWCEMGCPAIHHSDTFRDLYRPSYRVIANKFITFLRLFSKIDKLSDKECIIIAIEGGSASGKTTLAELLKEVYDCNVFHMDDFFLRPEQRTPSRLAEIGGNVDRERFDEEIIVPLLKNHTVTYRPFDCLAQTLGEAVSVTPGKVNIVEGVYSTHPAFSHYYDLCVFLDIDTERQKERILLRNGERMAKRFFDEWIPLENKYFSGTDITSRADLVFIV